MRSIDTLMAEGKAKPSPRLIISGVTHRFSRNMAAARMHAGMKQKDLAKRLEIDQSYVSMLEAGTRIPDIELADRIAKALDVKLSDLLEGRPFAQRP